MRISVLVSVLMLLALPQWASAQTERALVRKGNKQYSKEQYRDAAASYGRYVVQDTTSFASQYNLAAALYKLEDWKGANAALDAVENSTADKGVAPAVRANPEREGNACLLSDYYYNKGNLALQEKNYQAAVEAFKQSLILNPDDIDAKENYIYAKLMLQNQQNGGGGGQNDQEQNQDQNDQNQPDPDQNQDDQQNDQNQQNGDDNQSSSQQEPAQSQSQVSKQQAQQMLKAIQAAERKTQEKVNAEKAERAKVNQKDKNW